MKTISIASRVVATAALLASVVSGPAVAQMNKDVIRIGILNDMSGPYADLGGPGSVAAAKLAAEDMGGAINGVKIDIISGDHQNKPDIGSALARRWFDEDGVDAIADVPVSSVALAVQDIARQKKRITLMQGTSSDLSGKACSPYSTAWQVDTYAYSKAPAQAVVQSGGKSWFFIEADYAFGQALARDAGGFIKGAGGKVIGEARHPINSGDMSSYLLQAQSSGAEVVGLLNGGTDLINSIKQAHEFGITAGGQRLVAFLLYLTDVHALGLETAQGLMLANGFYWNQNDVARSWSKRYFEKMKRMPTQEQASVYASVMHYLKAVKAADTLDADAVAAKMREIPVDYFGNAGTVRADGRVTYPLTLYQVKKPSESKAPWDYYEPVRSIDAKDAFRPMNEGGCPLVK